MNRVLIGIAMCAACSSGEPATWTAFGDEASLAVVRDGDAVTAYICGSTADGLEDWTRWFVDGTWDDESTVLGAEGWELTLAEEGEALTAELSGPAGEVAQWSPTTSQGAGLFAHSGNCRDAAIVSGDRAVGAWCDENLNYFQVEPVGTLVPTVDGTLSFRATFDEAPVFEASQVFP